MGNLFQLQAILRQAPPSDPNMTLNTTSSKVNYISIARAAGKPKLQAYFTIVENYDLERSNTIITFKVSNVNLPTTQLCTS